ncbi:MAG: hypothetical protein JWM89_3517 [Acidimicrobiales bacterium]|nr:hypothetical protein [Acidimicrobiales bacterium]
MPAERNRQVLNLTPAPSTSEDFELALSVIVRSGVEDLVRAELYGNPGRHRRDDLRGLLVAGLLNALLPAHTGELTAVTRIMNGFSSRQRTRLGIADWIPGPPAYKRVTRLFAAMAALDNLETVSRDPERLDGVAHRIANSLILASIPPEYHLSTSVAIDGTDVETFAACTYADNEIELDGDPGPSEQETAYRHTSKPGGAHWQVLAIGPDGRKRYTKDPTARAGHRSATANRRAGPYIGHELHLMTQVRDCQITNPVNGATLGPRVPHLIRGAYLAEAGAHRARVGRKLVELASSDWAVGDVVTDRGYTRSPAEFQLLLRASGRRVFFDLYPDQRGDHPTTKGVRIVDGWPYSRAPSPLLDSPAPPPRPPRNRSHDAKLPYFKAYEDRATYRWSLHAGPDADGSMRFRGPFAAGRLRSRAYPRTMRGSETKPLVDLPSTWDRAFDGTATFQAAELPHWQPTIPYSRAWDRAYMARRQGVESANAGLKEAGADIGNHKHIKVFGTVKRALMLAFEIAAYNIRRIRTFEAGTQVLPTPETPGPSARAPRRVGTFQSIVAEAAATLAREAAGPPSPPP